MPYISGDMGELSLKSFDLSRVLLRYLFFSSLGLLSLTSKSFLRAPVVLGSLSL